MARVDIGVGLASFVVEAAADRIFVGVITVFGVGLWETSHLVALFFAFAGKRCFVRIAGADGFAGALMLDGHSVLPCLTGAGVSYFIAAADRLGITTGIAVRGFRDAASDIVSALGAKRLSWTVFVSWCATFEDIITAVARISPRRHSRLARVAFIDIPALIAATDRVEIVGATRGLF